MKNDSKSKSEVKSSQSLQDNAKRILTGPVSTLNTAFDSQNIKNLFGSYKIYDQDFSKKRGNRRKTAHAMRTEPQTLERAPSESDKENEEKENKAPVARRESGRATEETRKHKAFESTETQKHEVQRPVRNNFMEDQIDDFFAAHQKQFRSKTQKFGDDIELKRRIEDLENTFLHWRLSQSKR